MIPRARSGRRAAAARFLRAAGLAFAAGALMGAVHGALGLRSPAPPLPGLTGLLGIVIGERAASAVTRGRRFRFRRSEPPGSRTPGDPSSPEPPPAPPPEDPTDDPTR